MPEIKPVKLDCSCSSGYVTCRACGGKGEIKTLNRLTGTYTTTYCNNCNHGLVICDRCGGQGYYFAELLVETEVEKRQRERKEEEEEKNRIESLKHSRQHDDGPSGGFGAEDGFFSDYYKQH